MVEDLCTACALPDPQKCCLCVLASHIKWVKKKQLKEGQTGNKILINREI